MTRHDRLRRRAERGTPRGGDLVWAAALARADIGRPEARPRRWLVPAAAAAVAAVVVLPVLLLRGDGAERAPSANDPTSAVLTPGTGAPRPGPTDSPAQTGQEGLDDIVALSNAYRACATGPGFDPGGVQVIVSADGKPLSVKTGVDVPAEIHRVCLVEIGGDDPLASSFGNPSPLGECQGVDRTPPIEWDPAPTGSIDAATVLAPLLGPVRPGGAADLSWSVAGLEVPRDLVVECWNGQAWAGAYVVKWVRDGMPPITPEYGPDVELRPGTRPVDGTTVELPVPGNVPAGTYRVVAEGALCSGSSDCEAVPFAIEFVVGR